MANISLARRGFIATIVGLMPGVVLPSPKRLQAAKPEIKDLMRQMELQALQSSKPDRNPSMICRTLGEKTILYREKGGKREPLCGVNLMGKTIWEACDGKNSPKEISRMIHERHLVSKHRAWVDTLSFLWRLKEIGAIL